jgi:hypothetical protein
VLQFLTKIISLDQYSNVFFFSVLLKRNPLVVDTLRTDVEPFKTKCDASVSQ